MKAMERRQPKQAFGADRKVVNRWWQRLTKVNGRLSALIPFSTRPHRKRIPTTDIRIVEWIRKQRHHFFYQKPNYRVYHNPNSAWVRKAVKRKKRLRIKHFPKPQDYGYILSDTVEKIIAGVKRYFMSAVDAKLKFALTLEYSKITAKNMKDFYFRFKEVYPAVIKVWQSDNASENLGIFNQELKKNGIPHLFIYPRCPKIDTFIERYNRTIQEEYLDYHLDELIDPKKGNQLLADWNIYYNTQRRHHSLGLKSPLQYFIEKRGMSQKYLTYTTT